MLLLWVLGCTGGTALEITAPSDRAVVQVGAGVALLAVVDGRGVDATWSADGWEGVSGVATDLPLGVHTLEARAVVGGQVLTDTVEVEVVQVSRETDYTGLIDMDIDAWSSEYGDFTVECRHDRLELTAETDGTLTGEGVCFSPLGPYLFTVEGAIDGTSVTGVFAAEGFGGLELEFAGERYRGIDLDCTYDQTFVSEDGLGSMRLYGGFTAWPSVEDEGSVE